MTLRLSSLRGSPGKCIVFVCLSFLYLLCRKKVLCEFFKKLLRINGAASSFRVLKIIFFDSISISSLIVFRQSVSVN